MVHGVGLGRLAKVRAPIFDTPEDATRWFRQAHTGVNYRGADWDSELTPRLPPAVQYGFACVEIGKSRLKCLPIRLKAVLTKRTPAKSS